MRFSTSHKILLAASLLALAACGEIRSHSDFEALVKDKSTAEVEKKLGKPTAVEEANGAVRWTYDKQTFSTDEGNTKFDKHTIVVFRKLTPESPLKAQEVIYQRDSNS